jgi:hypothetical protein
VRSHPEIRDLSVEAKNHAAVVALFLVMFASILGNFASAAVAKVVGYRKAVVGTLAAYFVVMVAAYAKPRPYNELLGWLFAIGLCQGVFGLFTMALPPLFPTLLRTTGAGFCYNIGRIVAAAGTVFFGIFTKVNDQRQALFYAAFLFAPAALVGLLLPTEPESPRD